MIKSPIKLSNAFYFKDLIHKEPTCGIVYKFRCELCIELDYGESVKYLNARTQNFTITEKESSPKGLCRY